MEEYKYERVGEHWAESIGIPGIPNSQFEVRHRTRNGEHFIDGMYFIGPRGAFDVLKEIGVDNARIYVDETKLPAQSTEDRDCRVSGVRNVTEVIVAMHESAHQAEGERSISGLLMPMRPLSLLQMKRVLKERDIIVRKSDEELEEFDSLVSKFRGEYDSLSPTEKMLFTTRIKQLGDKELFDAFSEIAEVIREQDATGRVLTTLHKIEKAQGIDFSKVELNPPKQYTFEYHGNISMPPKFNPNSMTAVLEIGLASHKADVPLFEVCKRLLGNLCELKTQGNTDNDVRSSAK